MGTRSATRRFNLCGLLTCAAVGAPIGRPFCPVRFGRLSANRQCCFRRAAIGRPYEKVQSVRLAFRTAVGAPIGRPFCPVRPARLSANRRFRFRRAAGGRPYERAPSVRPAFRTAVGAPIGRPILPFTPYPIFPQTGNFVSGGRPVAAPTRRPHLCRSHSGAP